MGSLRAGGARKGAVVAAVVAAAIVSLSQGQPPASASKQGRTAPCAGNPWASAAFQKGYTDDALAAMVLGCLKQEFPRTFRHDEVGLVSLNSYPWYQNVNEFGLTSTVQRDMARLGMPPITLQDGPEGLITKTTPGPTALPNELALGATFDTSLANTYGSVLGSQAHQMGYDAVQAPDLNVVRVPAWGRASESFGESPVLAGELGGAESVAIENHHVMVVLKHFGPYSQETDRRALDQKVSQKAFEEVYVRPFTLALRALAPLLRQPGHALGIMCSYGNVNQQKACRSSALPDELSSVGETALLRSDLDVKVDPTALLLNGIDLIKPMQSSELVAALGTPAIGTALDQAVAKIFSTEFAAGLVTGRVTVSRRPLSWVMAYLGRASAQQIETRAAVLLKNDGVLPLQARSGRIAVVSDSTLTNTCRSLADTLSRTLSTATNCVNDGKGGVRPTTLLFRGLPVQRQGASRSTSFTAPASGPYVVTVATLGNTRLTLDGTQILNTQGLAEYKVQRTALVGLSAGSVHTFTVSWRGAGPHVVITQEQPAVNAAVAGVAGAKAAIVVAYDLAREGMDRSSLDLPGVQNAVISAVAARVPTIVLLATDGAVTMPWLSQVHGVMEVWNPTGSVQLDRVLAQYVTAWRSLLIGTANPTGRLPVTFPVTTQQSPMSNQAFWPGINTAVDLDQPAYHGLGLGLPWYRQMGWPVQFPLGFGLSYTTYKLVNGSVTNGANGLQATVNVRDTGATGGTEVVQVYANFPGALGEPRGVLVGFGTVTFARSDAHGAAVRQVVIPLLPDALSTYSGGTMHIAKGPYCLAASTYDGDPHSVATGSVTLAPTGANGVAIASGGAMSPGTCPG